MLLEKNKILMSLFSFVLYLLVCLKTHPPHHSGGEGRSGDVKCQLIFEYLTACS